MEFNRTTLRGAATLIGQHMTQMSKNDLTKIFVVRSIRIGSALSRIHSEGKASGRKDITYNIKYTHEQLTPQIVLTTITVDAEVVHTHRTVGWCSNGDCVPGKGSFQAGALYAQEHPYYYDRWEQNRQTRVPYRDIDPSIRNDTIERWYEDVLLPRYYDMECVEFTSRLVKTDVMIDVDTIYGCKGTASVAYHTNAKGETSKGACLVVSDRQLYELEPMHSFPVMGITKRLHLVIGVGRMVEKRVKKVKASSGMFMTMGDRPEDYRIIKETEMHYLKRDGTYVPIDTHKMRIDVLHQKYHFFYPASNELYVDMLREIYPGDEPRAMEGRVVLAPRIADQVPYSVLADSVGKLVLRQVLRRKTSSLKDLLCLLPHIDWYDQCEHSTTYGTTTFYNDCGVTCEKKLSLNELSDCFWHGSRKINLFERATTVALCFMKLGESTGLQLHDVSNYVLEQYVAFAGVTRYAEVATNRRRRRDE